MGSSNTVAVDFGRALFGSVGGTVFAFMVAVSCFGALNGAKFNCISIFSTNVPQVHFLPVHALSMLLAVKDIYPLFLVDCTPHAKLHLMPRFSRQQSLLVLSLSAVAFGHSSTSL